MLFFNVKYDAQNINSNKFDKIRYSEIPNKIVLFLSLTIFFIAMFKKNLKKRRFIFYYYIIYVFDTLSDWISLH